MSGAEELIDSLVEVGAKLDAENGRLIVRAGARPIPGELVRRLRGAKAEVLAVLAPKRIDAAVANAEGWRRQFAIRTMDRELSGTRAFPEAARLAWGELECRWHRLH